MLTSRMVSRPILGLFTALITSFSSALYAEPPGAESAIHMLGYIATDYPGAVTNGQVTNTKEYDEQLEFAVGIVNQIAQLAPGKDYAWLRDKANSLVDAIQTRQPATRIEALAHEIARDVADEFHIALAPNQVPDVVPSAGLYAEQCAGCHGARGHGDGPLARQQHPAPTNFADPSRADWVTLHGLYSAISRGVPGTSMTAFSNLTEAQRWGLAFYVSDFSATDAQRARGQQVWESGTLRDAVASVTDLTATSVASMRTAHGEDGAALLVYLRAHPEQLARNFSTALNISIAKLHESVTAMQRGERKHAYDAAVTAYLQGYELVETQMRLSAPELSDQIEEKMALLRVYLDDEAATIDGVKSRAEELFPLLELGKEQTAAGSVTPWMGAFSAFILLLREGVEAILVLSAIVAFLVKSERRESLRYVHSGWISALVLGGLTWVIAARVFTISGTNRELTEGVTALLAAAILVYMGYWLHSNANVQRWKQFLNEKLQGGSLWTLVAISFLAVYREVFETILFFETLWLQMPDSHGALINGILAAALVLAAIAWGMFRFSLRLPLRLFFNVNAVLLFLLAVIFTGKGIAALQEAGTLRMHPVHFPQIDLLGVYPNFEVLGAQLVLLTVAAGWLVIARVRVKKG